MRIAICDDDYRDIDHLRKYILSHPKGHEVVTFLSANVFMQQIYSGEHFDLLFLDVQMPDSDGWETALELKRIKSKIFIAMVTVWGEYIYDCFDRVDWFTAKPVSKEKVFRILDSAQEKLFPVICKFLTEGMTIELSTSEIIYFEIRRNILTVHSVHAAYPVKMSLKAAKALVANCPQFVQVHSSFVINLDHYCETKGSNIVMKNQEEIKISRTYRDSFFSGLSEYVRRP